MSSAVVQLTRSTAWTRLASSPPWLYVVTSQGGCAQHPKAPVNRAEHARLLNFRPCGTGARVLKRIGQRVPQRLCELVEAAGPHEL